MLSYGASALVIFTDKQRLLNLPLLVLFQFLFMENASDDHKDNNFHSALKFSNSED